MKKRGIVTLSALLATTALVCLYPRLTQKTPAPEKGVQVLRVWVTEDERAVTVWLKERAAAYEKQEKRRVYLRAASRQEAEAALRGEAGVVPPDIMVMPGLDSVVALRGYGLFVRNTAGAAVTPMPTGALFSRPTPEPKKTREPLREPNWAALTAVLCPKELTDAVPNAVETDDPAAAFAAGKAEAAVLTAGQAGQLPFGYAAYPLPNGFLPVTARAFSADGGSFLSFLRGRISQFALRDAGLYTALPNVRLYDESQPLRAMIEDSL